MGAVLSALLERGRVRGERRAGQRRRAIAAMLADEIADVAVSIEDESVVVTGRGVRWRALSEPALRWIGRMR